jgi:DNA repair exonuclease SbcCD ATPase subunit
MPILFSKDTPMASTAKDFTSSGEMPSVRYQRLMEALSKAMEDAKAALDLRSVIQDCYGDDGASIFHAADDEALLRGLFLNMLDKAHRTALERMKSYMADKNLDKALAEMEAVIALLERQEADAKAREAAAKARARRAAQAAALPPGVSHSSLVRYYSYQGLLQDARELERQIRESEQEVQDLEAKNKGMKARVQARIDELHRSGRDLERSADMCTMIS